MGPEMTQILSSGGAGAAVIVVTVIYLRFLRTEREQLMADRREERREFLARLEQISEMVGKLSKALSDRPCLFERDH